jgi:hypothetical protein
VLSVLLLTIVLSVLLLTIVLSVLLLTIVLSVLLLTIVLSVLLQNMDSDFPFSIFKLFLNSDGQQFHQYQHSEQPPIISNAKRPSHLWHLDIHFLARDRHTYMARLNRLKIVQPPFDNWISNDKIDIKKP